MFVTLLVIFLLVALCLQIILFLNCLNSRRKVQKRFLQLFGDFEKCESSKAQSSRPTMFKKYQVKDFLKNNKRKGHNSKLELVRAKSTNSIFNLSTLSATVTEPLSFLSKVRFQACKKNKLKPSCCNVRGARTILNNLVRSEVRSAKQRSSDKNFYKADEVDDDIGSLPYSHRRCYSEGDVTFRSKKEYYLDSICQQSLMPSTYEKRDTLYNVNEVSSKFSPRTEKKFTKELENELSDDVAEASIDDEVRLCGYREIESDDEVRTGSVNLIRTISKILTKTTDSFRQTDAYSCLQGELTTTIVPNQNLREVIETSKLQDSSSDDSFHLSSWLPSEYWSSSSSGEEGILSDVPKEVTREDIIDDSPSINRTKVLNVMDQKPEITVPTSEVRLEEGERSYYINNHRSNEDCESVGYSSLILHDFDPVNVRFNSLRHANKIKSCRPNVNQRSFSNPENGNKDSKRKIRAHKLERNPSISLDSTNTSENSRTIWNEIKSTNKFNQSDKIKYTKDQERCSNNHRLLRDRHDVHNQSISSSLDHSKAVGKTIRSIVVDMPDHASSPTERNEDRNGEEDREGNLVRVDHCSDGSRSDPMEVKTLTRSYESIILQEQHRLDFHHSRDVTSNSLNGKQIRYNSLTSDAEKNQFTTRLVNFNRQSGVYQGTSYDIDKFRDKTGPKLSDPNNNVDNSETTSGKYGYQILEIKAQIHQQFDGRLESQSCCSTSSSDESVSELSSASSDLLYDENNQRVYEEIPEDYKKGRRDQREKKVLQGLDDLIQGVPAPDYETCDTSKAVHGDLSTSLLTPPPLPARGPCPSSSQEYDDDQSIKSSICHQNIEPSSGVPPPLPNHNHKSLVRTDSVSSSGSPKKSLSRSSQPTHRALSKSVSEPRTYSTNPLKRSSDSFIPPPPPPPQNFSSVSTDDNESTSSISSDEGKQRIERTQSLPEGSDHLSDGGSSSSGRSSKGSSFIPPKFPTHVAGQGLIKPSEYLRSLVDINEIGHPEIYSLPSIPETKEEEIKSEPPIPPPPPPFPVATITNGVSPPSRTQSNDTNGNKAVMPSISVTDLQSVQLRKTEQNGVKSSSVPLKIKNGDSNFLTQRHDVIAELKMGVDIDGIKKLKNEKVKEDIDIVQKEKEQLKKTFNADMFVEQISDIDPNGNPIPLWKRQMLAKKAAEKAKKEAEDQKLRDMELKRIQEIPPWKRQLMAKKEIERQRNPLSVPKVEDIKRIKIGHPSPCKENNNKTLQQQDKMKKKSILKQPIKIIEIIEKKIVKPTNIVKNIIDVPQILTVKKPEENEEIPIPPVPWRSILKKTSSNLILADTEEINN